MLLLGEEGDVWMHLRPHCDVFGSQVVQVAPGVEAQVVGDRDPQGALAACKLVLQNQSCDLPALAHTCSCAALKAQDLRNYRQESNRDGNCLPV